MHTTASDGRLSPAELVTLAVELRMTHIAITDHETTAGLAEAQSAAAAHGLTVLPGLELGTEGDAGHMDLLGYCFDVENAALQDMLTRLRAARVVRAQEMVDKLNKLDATITLEQVQAASNGGAIGRPHVARALLNAGHVNSITEAFERWIGGKGPAYVARFRLEPAEGIRLIREAGGIVGVAHPVRSGKVKQIPALVEAGLNALEVWYPHHSRRDVKKLLRLTGKYGLIPTGGSDFHGPSLDGTISMGSVPLPLDVIDRLVAT